MIGEITRSGFIAEWWPRCTMRAAARRRQERPCRNTFANIDFDIFLSFGCKAERIDIPMKLTALACLHVRVGYHRNLVIL